MADTRPASVFRFGPFEADLENRQLLKNGLSVGLRGKPFDVLALLLEHAGQLVTRERLRARLWPSGTVVEFDHGIHVAVTKVREALGEDAEYPRFIETVPRHGYRFIARVSRPAAATEASPTPQVSARSLRPFWRRPAGVVTTMIALLAVAGGYLAVDKLWISERAKAARSVTSGAEETSARAATAGAVASFNPPAHSIAVLPFANLSGQKEQEYFSDGLTEELLNALASIPELQVAAQTSSFYFKGKDVDLQTIARRLNVGAVLEGSVRRSADTVRISAQLIDTGTGFHIWSQTYDRKLSDVLKLQTEIATAVASALQVALLGDVAARVELGGTRNPSAFDAYLRGEKAYSSVHVPARDLPGAIAAYTEAIRLDPRYALAVAARSLAFSVLTWETATFAASRETLAKAQADARQAVALAPDLARAHLAFALAADTNLDLMQASEAYQRALALAPGNAEVLRYSGVSAAQKGQFDKGLAAVRRAVALDPLNRESHYYLGWALYAAHRYEEAVSAYAEVITLEPDFEENYGFRGLAYYGLGDLQSARASCETKPDFWASHWCLAVTYDKLGRHSDAETELSKLKAVFGDDWAFQYATIYAQWGDRVKALEWLDRALRLRDGALATLKTFPLLDPLRKEPRFQAIERELKFPSARSAS